MYGDTLSERRSHLSHYNASHSCSHVLKIKALIHWAIFLVTSLAILLRHKLHESLLSVTCLAIFLLPQPLPEVEVGSTSCNADCNKNVARHVNFRGCYTTQRSVQLVSQRLNEIARQVARKTAQCNSGLRRNILYILTVLTILLL